MLQEKSKNSRTETFEKSKDALANATMLVHPLDGTPLAVTVDAFVIAISGVLEQHIKGQWQPLGFFSTPLRSKQSEWVPFNSELLATHRSIHHFPLYGPQQPRPR